MQRLVDAAVVVVAMVIPPLGSKLLEETVHGRPPFVMGRRWRFVDLRACARPHSSRRAYASAGKTRGVKLAEADEREVAERRHRTALDEIGGRRSAGPALEARPREFRPPAEPLRDGL